jgi:hypothetical protein
VLVIHSAQDDISPKAWEKQATNVVSQEESECWEDNAIDKNGPFDALVRNRNQV